MVVGSMVEGGSNTNNYFLPIIISEKLLNTEIFNKI